VSVAIAGGPNPPAQARPPGRPRSPEADRAILNATLEVLALMGFGRLTVEGVATHAGVGKATIYRRWPSKMSLVLAAVGDLSSTPSPEMGAGTTRDDLITLLRHIIDALTATIAGRILPGLIAETPHSPELREALHDFWLGRRELMLEVLAAGVARGEISPDADRELVADLLYGPVHYRFLISAGRLDGGFAEELVGSVLDVLAPALNPKELKP
jgi:AcrR family transcriptional regulator